MKRIFLTSGLVLCMACPAFADLDANNKVVESPNTGANATCQEPTLGGTSGTSTFTAKWIADEYAIEYATGMAGSRTTGFSGTMADTPAKFDDSVTLRTNAFSITGYNFTGWKSTVDIATNTQGDTSYGDEATINPYKVPGNVTLTAQWTPKNYTVTYDAGQHGTGGEIDTNGATYDAEYVAWTETHARVEANSGYTFQGWSLSNGATEGAWTGENPWTRDSDLTVYAAYTANQYTIAFDCNKPSTASQQVSADPTAVSVNMDGTTTLNQTCSLPGWTFTGWNCTTGLTVTAGTTENPVSSILASDLTTGYTVNLRQAGTEIGGVAVTCTAQWEAKTIGLSYDLDGGQGDDTPSSCTFDGTISLPANPTKTGYTFDGWQVDNTPAVE